MCRACEAWQCHQTAGLFLTVYEGYTVMTVHLHRILVTLGLRHGTVVIRCASLELPMVSIHVYLHRWLVVFKYRYRALQQAPASLLTCVCVCACVPRLRRPWVGAGTRLTCSSRMCVTGAMCIPVCPPLRHDVRTACQTLTYSLLGLTCSWMATASV